MADLGTSHPLGYDIPFKRGGPILDHLANDGDRWCFSEGPVPEDGAIFEIGKRIAPTRKQAGAIAKFTLMNMGWAYEAGVTAGRQQAQRHYQLSLGLVVPTREERALWNNPVPLRKEGSSQSTLAKPCGMTISCLMLLGGKVNLQ